MTMIATFEACLAEPKSRWRRGLPRACAEDNEAGARSVCWLACRFE
jgi:hypothetical protein